MPSTETTQPSLAAWFSTPTFAGAEIVRSIGYTTAVLDIEHGTFDLAALERYIPFLRAIGLTVIAKVLAPERGPIQQALDFGADAVAIPHVENLEHAKAITQMGKFPPRGDRSLAGGRTCGYGGADDKWYMDQDHKTSVYPMIEDAGAIEDIAGILALETVDGVFIGPSDLSLRRNRGAYTASPDDFEDIKTIAHACKAAGKPWVMPAWADSEKELALRYGASTVVLTMEHGAIMDGFSRAYDAAQKLMAK